MNKLNEAVNTKKYDTWDDCLIPTEQDFNKVLEHKNNYDTNGKNCVYISTPWGLTNSVKDSAKKIKYFIVSVILGWDEVAKRFAKILVADGYKKQELEAIKDTELRFASDFDKILNKLRADGKLTESIEKHKELNPKLFTADNKLKATIINKINQIVAEFLADLANDEIKIKVKDTVIIGSNASYNYTKNSDLDVHIIADTKSLECPDNLYPLLYSAYRCIFNSKFDIDFYGIPVELFVETEDNTTVSNGIYSVTKNKWIKEPVEADIPDYDEEGLKKELKIWTDKYNEVINNDSLKDETKVLKLIDAIYELRKNGIKVDGEYSVGNLVFKEFRNAGKLDKLKELKNELISKRLSITESISRQNREEAKIKISNIAHSQAIMQDNGYFQIYNVPEINVDTIIAQLNKLDCVEKAQKGGLGKLNFNRLKPDSVPIRTFSIIGKVKEII